MGARPQLHVIAGPNGSGKTTYANSWNHPFTIHNPDDIAKNAGGDAGNRLIAAGRIIHERIYADIGARRSFGFETTMAGTNWQTIMKTCVEQNYFVYLHFICVQNLDVSRSRVAQRVSIGGHGVPEVDQLRRFQRVLDNLPKAILLADAAYIYDNSEKQGHKLIGCYDHGINTYRSNSFDWLPT